MEFINKTGVDRIKLNPYVVPIAVGENTLLINPLHGTADLVSNDEAEYAQCCTPGIWPELDEVLLTRGYWIWGGAVTALLQLLWEKDLCIPQMPHYSLLITYVCNFDCSYCYQSSRVVRAEKATMSRAQCEAVMDFVAHNGPGLVSLYGGEPLLPVNESQVTWITNRALELGCDVAVTTNGWWLEEFLPAFPEERTKWIEVTCHDVQGGALAPKVVRGLRAAISVGHRVQVRTVFGFSTMHRIPAFLDGLKKAELLGRVKVSFGSLLGPPDGGLHREDVLFAGGNEVLTESGFKPYFPGGDVLERLFETGVLKPRCRRCGAGKGILVFDPAGDIHPCWYAVGVQVMSTLLEKFRVVQPRQPRLYIVPSFDCNLSCIYCNQWDLNNNCKMHHAMVVSAFDMFDRAMEDFANRSTIGVPQRPMVHLYGGEPLLPANMAIVENILDEAKKRGYTVSVITNGVHVPDFVQLFDKYRDVVKSFLITVDGPPEVHNNRRPCKDGKGTFALVDAGISQLLEKEFKVTVQAVVDAASIPALVWLARYARSQGWLDRANCKLAAAKVMFPMCNPPPRYNMQDADDVSFIEAYLQTLSQHPDEVSLFSVPTGEIGVLQFLSRVLGSPSLIPFPQLSGCDATNGLIWALGSDGLVYCCVETIGYQSFAVGQYYPVYKADTDAIERWGSLRIRERETCLLCDWVTVCGGGCALKSLVSNRDCACPPNQLLFETYLDNAQTLVRQVLSGPVSGGKR